MDELLNKLVKRIKPTDGLVVDAQVWAEAHNYHFVHQRAHLLFGHGAGILTGLSLKIEDNTNRVWVRPGIAIDNKGHLIILEEQESARVPVNRTGLVYVYALGSEESLMPPAKGSSVESPRYVRDGKILESGSSLPAQAVELGRIRLLQPDRPISPARDRNQPGPNELDLRFRPETSIKVEPTVGVAITYLGEQTGEFLPRYGSKAGDLANATSHLIPYRLAVDEDIHLSEDLSRYTLLYVIEQGQYQLRAETLESLSNFVHRGGTLLVESYSSVSTLLPNFGSLGVEFNSVMLEGLLVRPYLFSTPPPGFNHNQAELRVGQGVIYSTCDYGHLWQRAPLDDPLRSRTAIRAATEWLANIVTYAVERCPRYRI